MRTSVTGIDLIKNFEGFSPRPYLCPAGHLTIGYGHVVRENERFSLLTKLQADDLLRNDLLRFENSVNRLINISLKQNQFDSLVSFTFNLGAGALQRSTLRQKVNRGEHSLAAAEFLRWVYAGGRALKGLALRRQAESALYSL